VVHIDGREPENGLAEVRGIPAGEQAKAIRLFWSNVRTLDRKESGYLVCRGAVLYIVCHRAAEPVRCKPGRDRRFQQEFNRQWNNRLSHELWWIPCYGSLPFHGEECGRAKLRNYSQQPDLLFSAKHFSHSQQGYRVYWRFCFHSV